MDDVRWACRRWLRRQFATHFPQLYAAYVALSPKHRRIRESKLMGWAYRWHAKRKLSMYIANRIDKVKLDYMSGKPVMIGWDMAKRDD